MAYGPNGAQFPDHGPRPAQPQPGGQYSQEQQQPQEAPWHGEVTPSRQPRAARRPQAYDPFQTRARDQAAERRRQESEGGRATRGGLPRWDASVNPGDQGPGAGDTPYGAAAHGGGRPGADYSGEGRQWSDQPHDAQQYGDRYGSDRRGADRQGRGRFGDGRYDRADPYDPADPYAVAGDGHEPGPGPASPTRAALRAGATSLLEDGEGRSRGPRASEPDGGDGPEGRTPGGRADRRKGKKPVPPHIRRRRKIVRRSILGVFLVLSGYVGVTLYPYITAPGTTRLSARIAEWGRDHKLGWAVTWLENSTYKAPPTGGSLNSSQLSQLQGPTAGPPTTKAKAVDLPANIIPLAVGTIPGEGVWHPVRTNAANMPIVEKAALRPDAQHTSALAYAVWMNQTALTFQLHPGFQQPGGSWQTADSITTGARSGLVATWNGGFKISPDDALGGFFAGGRTAHPLVNGKAAEVFYQDGSVKIGQWGRDESMAPNVVGVRQNLSLLVDGGQVTVGPGDGSGAQWGYTIKNSYYIARSGVGMTAKGDIVYVSGGELSVYTLAKLLQAAGSVYAMELDINPDWVSYMYYDGDPANPTPNKLWNFVQPANRYFEPSDRDFVSVYVR
jgi:hypothetical protein